MIKTFRSRGAELLFARKSVALFQAIELAQGVKLILQEELAQLNAAAELRDLTVPPENLTGCGKRIAFLFDGM